MGAAFGEIRIEVRHRGEVEFARVGDEGRILQGDDEVADGNDLGIPIADAEDDVFDGLFRTFDFDVVGGDFVAIVVGIELCLGHDGADHVLEGGDFRKRFARVHLADVGRVEEF